MSYTSGTVNTTRQEPPRPAGSVRRNLDLPALPGWMKASGRNWVVAGEDKIPLDPKTGKRASITDATTWASFVQARGRAIHDGLHLGLVLHRSPQAIGTSLIVIDIDHCIDDDGTLSPEAATIVNELKSYTEVSRSGRGLHILLNAELPPGRRRFPGGIEIYDRDRYVILTGDIRPEWGRPEIMHREAKFTALYERLCAAIERDSPPAVSPSTSLKLDDEPLLAKAFAAGNGKGAELERLLAGDLSRHNNDHSAADLAAASGLYFWTQDDAQVERIISTHPLGAREKWQKRADYRRRTLAKARQRATFYSPPTPTSPPSTGSHTVPPAPESPAADGSAAYITELERHIAQLEREKANLHAALDQCCDDRAELRSRYAEVRAERDQARRDLSAVIATLGNPNLGGDVAGKALVLAAADVQHRAHSRPPEDGYVQVNATRVADATYHVDGERIEGPAKISPRTITKYVGLAAEAGLIDAKKDDIPAPADKPGIRNQGWYWKAAPTLADQLGDLTKKSVYSDDNPKPLRGGDPKKRRNLKPLPVCPSCGERHVACLNCGTPFDLPTAIDLDSGDLLAVDMSSGELLPERAPTSPNLRSHTVPPSNDGVLPTVVDVVLVVKDGNRDPGERSHTVPSSPHLPGLDLPPTLPPDRWTDGGYVQGARR
jgi:putative DNA primase/helicase